MAPIVGALIGAVAPVLVNKLLGGDKPASNPAPASLVPTGGNFDFNSLAGMIANAVVARLTNSSLNGAAPYPPLGGFGAPQPTLCGTQQVLDRMFGLTSIFDQRLARFAEALGVLKETVLAKDLLMTRYHSASAGWLI